jgi:tripartite-type tricarboxylate transporter receptor subunit TctC
MIKKILATLAACLIATSVSAGANRVPPMPKELEGKVIRVIICRAVGAQTDITQRFMLEQATRLTGLKFVPLNIPAAQGLLASKEVAESPADGLTLFAGDNTIHVVNPVLPPPGYVDVEQIPVIAIHAFSPQFFYVSAKSNIHTLKDLINAAKKNPKFNAGHPTIHSMLIQSEFFGKNGAEVNFVPYTKATEMPIQIDIGDLNTFLSSGADNKPMVDKGVLRAVGTSWDRPLNIYPNARPISDYLPGFRSSQQQLIAIHRDTPQHIKEYFNTVFRLAGQTAESRARWEMFSMIPGSDLDINSVQRVIKHEQDGIRRMNDRVVKLQSQKKDK